MIGKQLPMIQITQMISYFVLLFSHHTPIRLKADPHFQASLPVNIVDSFKGTFNQIHSIPLQATPLFPSPCLSPCVTLFVMDSSGWEQRKDAHRSNPPGRLVVRVTKSLPVPNWARAVCSTQPSRHEDTRPRTGTTLRDSAADLVTESERRVGERK